MFDAETIQRAIIATPVMLLALTVHEVAHARVAYMYGDPTAKNLGRFSMNPLMHLDLMGTLMFFLSGFRFGWAKPVPVNPFNLRNLRTADIWISAAGPISNLCQATIAAIIIHTMNLMNYVPDEIVKAFLEMAVEINVYLAIFNLIPLFPLDGSHILRNVVPEKYSNTINQFERFAPFILLIGIFTGVFGLILYPLAHICFTLLGYR